MSCHLHTLMIPAEQDYCAHSGGNRRALWSQSECLVILGFPPRVILDGHAHSLAGGGSSSGWGPDFSLILAPLNSLGWSQLDWPCWIQSYNSISTARRLPDFCLCTWCTAGGVGSNPSNTGSTWVTWSHSFDFSKTISLLWNGENLTDLVLVKHHDVEINYILISGQGSDALNEQMGERPSSHKCYFRKTHLCLAEMSFL